MTRMRGRVVGLLALMLVSASPGEGQIRKMTGAAVGDQIVVQLYAILADTTAYVPVARQHLELRGAGDSLTLITNDAGGVTVLLSPGPHYAVLRGPVWWTGRRLTWNVPFDVHPDMGEVLLTLRNATPSMPTLAATTTTTVSRGTVGSAAAPLMPPPATGRRGLRIGRVFVMIEGATWEIFEQELGSLAPARGERSPDSLYALMFTSDRHTRQLDRYPRDWRRLSDSALAGLFTSASVIEP